MAALADAAAADGAEVDPGLGQALREIGERAGHVRELDHELVRHGRLPSTARRRRPRGRDDPIVRRVRPAWRPSSPVCVTAVFAGSSRRAGGVASGGPGVPRPGGEAHNRWHARSSQLEETRSGRDVPAVHRRRVRGQCQRPDAGGAQPGARRGDRPRSGQRPGGRRPGGRRGGDGLRELEGDDAAGPQPHPAQDRRRPGGPSRGAGAPREPQRRQARRLRDRRDGDLRRPVPVLRGRLPPARRQGGHRVSRRAHLAVPARPDRRSWPRSRPGTTRCTWPPGSWDRPSRRATR